MGHHEGSSLYAEVTDRLDRDQKGAFGSERYAREELVAELTAAFTCASLYIHRSVRSRSISHYPRKVASNRRRLSRWRMQASGIRRLQPLGPSLIVNERLI